MTGTETRWGRYLRWNDAIADVVFSRDAAGIPVYLDLEDDVLDAIRDVADPSCADTQHALVEVVKASLDLKQGPTAVFELHLRALDRWRRLDVSVPGPPPTIGVLALLSLAAENMHAGEGKASNNFYFRLKESLDLSDVQLQRFENGYRAKRGQHSVSNELWQSLNEWLDKLEGNRGLATAVALSHAHIGYPMSQALVRRADREKFGEMFEAYGLAPHSSLPPSQVFELLDEWMSRVPCPVSNSLEKIWRSDATARERIAEVARLTLEAWDGAGSSGASQETAHHFDWVRLTALVRHFPSTALELSLVIPASKEDAVETVEVLDADEQPVASLDMVPITSAWLSPADATLMDAPSLLGGEVLLREKNRAQLLRRRPRRVIPLRRDDALQGAFLESERLQLGEQSMVLVHEALAGQAQEILQIAARPGFVRHISLSGLPDGWELFEDVQIMSSVPKELLDQRRVDLNVLQPLARLQVVLQGGLRLPGNIAKWSSFAAPELRVSSEEATSLSARLSCVRPLVEPAPPDATSEALQPVLVWDLSTEALPDGDYDLTVLEDGEPISQRLLRLRSADHPAIDLGDRTEIGHVPTLPGFGIVGSSIEGLAGFRGTPVGGELPLRSGTAPGPSAAWFAARQDPGVNQQVMQQVKFAKVNPSSCMVTGAHYMDIEMAQAGDSTVQGRCRTCGLIKRYPTKGKKKSTTSGTAKVAPTVDTLAIQAVQRVERIDWRAAFDAVCHVGAGPISNLEAIAGQMEVSGIFSDSFIRRLESLGHIEVLRDPESLSLRAWDVVEPTLMGLESGRSVLTGFRSESLMVAIEDHLYGLEVELDCDTSVDGPAVVELGVLTSEQAGDLLRVMEEACGRPARHIPGAALHLAASLPPLSKLIDELPMAYTIGARSYERWNPLLARFEPAIDASSAGAFRLRGFARAYVYRREQDLETSSAVLGDARLVKYAAALDSGVSLLGYLEDSATLYVPLGADLPGLYGRAAVLASGRPPFEDVEERILRYEGVSPELAGRLNNLLMS